MIILIGYISGIYGYNGKENGNYYIIYNLTRVYIGGIWV